MQKNYIVVEDYKNSNDDPIELKVEDSVILEDRSDGIEPWENWIYCISKRTKKEGWVPVQILQIEDEQNATVKADYVADEMSVSIGDILIGNCELNGWIWCDRKEDKKSGWVPKNCLKPI